MVTLCSFSSFKSRLIRQTYTERRVDWRQNIWDQTHTHQCTQLTVITNIIEREFVATAILSFYFLRTSSVAWGRGGCATRLFIFIIFPVQQTTSGIGHRVYAECEKQQCHKEVLSLQPMIPPKRFDIFSPPTGGCSGGLYGFIFFFKHMMLTQQCYYLMGEPA